MARPDSPESAPELKTTLFVIVLLLIVLSSRVVTSIYRQTNLHHGYDHALTDYKDAKLGIDKSEMEPLIEDSTGWKGMPPTLKQRRTETNASHGCSEKADSPISNLPVRFGRSPLSDKANVESVPLVRSGIISSTLRHVSFHQAIQELFSQPLRKAWNQSYTWTKVTPAYNDNKDAVFGQLAGITIE